VPSYDTVEISFDATPESGAVASQPLYINSAWVQVSDTLFVKTNSTYHQGAGIAVVTFSVSAGGSIYNAGRQALDYRTSPRAGILVVPDSGYVFAGWSHDEYRSLRGELIPASSGIMHFDSLIIYGDVELRAVFISGNSPKKETLIPDEPDDTNDKVWSNDGTLYVRTMKDVAIRLYTLDGILCRHFITTVDGLTTLRPGQGIYIVTLNDGTGWKIVIRE
jgi:hypothetical protein